MLRIPARTKKRLIPEKVMTQAWKKPRPSPSKARRRDQWTGILHLEIRAPIRMPRQTVKTVAHVTRKRWGSTLTRQMRPILRLTLHTPHAQVTTPLHDVVNAPMADSQLCNPLSAVWVAGALNSAKAKGFVSAE